MDRMFFPWEWSRLPTRVDSGTAPQTYCGIRFSFDETMPPGEAELRGPYGRVRVINLLKDSGS